MRNLKQSLCVEDFLRRVFLVPLTGKNLDELLNLTQDFAPKLKEHKLILEFAKCKSDFIGYELQYLYFLSFSALKAEDEAKFNEILRKKAEFIAAHPSQWFCKFAARCDEHANLDLWKSFGSFLNLYLNSEMDALKSALKDPEIFKNLKE